MKRFRDKIMRADPDFVKELNEIKLARIKCGKDKKFKSDRRLTKGILRHRFWPIIKQDAIESKLEEIEYE